MNRDNSNTNDTKNNEWTNQTETLSGIQFCGEKSSFESSSCYGWNSYAKFEEQTQKREHSFKPFMVVIVVFFQNLCTNGGCKTWKMVEMDFEMLENENEVNLAGYHFRLNCMIWFKLFTFIPVINGCAYVFMNVMCWFSNWFKS